MRLCRLYRIIGVLHVDSKPLLGKPGGDGRGLAVAFLERTVGGLHQDSGVTRGAGQKITACLGVVVGSFPMRHDTGASGQGPPWRG